MLRVLSLVVLLLSVTFISGCGKPENSFIGVWQVHEADTRAHIADAFRQRPDSKKPKATEEDVKKGVDLFWNLIKESNLRFDIRADKSFTLSAKDKVQEQGTWSLHASIMTLTVASDSPKKRAKPYTATANGGRLQITFNAEKSEIMSFERAR